MKVTVSPNRILLHNILQFDITQTFECGQCFRWTRQRDGSYVGVAGGRVLRVIQKENDICLDGTTNEEYETFWKRYFDMDRDYGKLQVELAGDDMLGRAINYGSGIRILAQEPFETLISFIISANNNIPRIRQIIGRLCENFGERLTFQNETFYRFPTPETLAGAKQNDLGVLRAGFRDSYILDAARRVAGGSLRLEELRRMPASEARVRLMEVKGVGKKVADCVLLFGLGHYEAFPVDVWIRRIVEHCYFSGNPIPCDFEEFVDRKFGNYAGLAQQYLFYYARELKIAK